METKKIQSIIDKIKTGNVILTDIELKNGVLFQFSGDYMNVYIGYATIHQYVGGAPKIEIEKDIWGEESLIIGYNYAKIKPSTILTIDTYDNEPEH